MSQTRTEIFVTRYQKNGGAFCVLIPPVIREALQLVPRDLVAMRLVGDSVVLVKLDTDRVLSIGDARRLVAQAKAQEASGGNGSARE